MPYAARRPWAPRVVPPHSASIELLCHSLPRLILLAIVVLIALSAFFNGSETALTAASRARMHALEQEGNVACGAGEQAAAASPRR